MSLTTTFLTDLPACDAVAIVPSDSVNQGPFRALYVGSAGGNVSLVTLGGNTVVFNAVPIGILNVACIRVNTATTSTNMVGLT